MFCLIMEIIQNAKRKRNPFLIFEIPEACCKQMGFWMVCLSCAMFVTLISIVAIKCIRTFDACHWMSCASISLFIYKMNREREVKTHLIKIHFSTTGLLWRYCARKVEFSDLTNPFWGGNQKSNEKKKAQLELSIL